MPRFSSDFKASENDTGPIMTGPKVLCKARSFQTVQNTFTHDCDSTEGASGSPIWVLQSNGFHQIVGIHAAAFNKVPGARHQRLSDDEVDQYPNVAVNATNPIILNLIKSLRERFPQGHVE